MEIIFDNYIMTTIYTKSLTTDFGGTINESSLHAEIVAEGGITPNLSRVERNGDVVDIVFDSALSAGEQTTLDTVISNHDSSKSNIIDIFITDVKLNATNSGTFTSGSWQTRVLNTISGNNKIATLANNQFTLVAGEYTITSESPAYNVMGHQIRLYNITDSTVDAVGTSANSNRNTIMTSKIYAFLNISATKTYEIQHYCEKTVADNGFGLPCGFGQNEVYTTIHIKKTN